MGSAIRAIRDQDGASLTPLRLRRFAYAASTTYGRVTRNR
jgi:hypothetical protein